MTQATSEFGFAAAVALRRKTTPLRLALMAAVALMLWSLGHWEWAPAWFAVYAVLQGAIAATTPTAPADGESPRQGLYCALSFISFTLAGAPTWHLWTQRGDLGVASSIMFLCGMLMQLVVGSLGARRLFWCSAAPLIAYLAVLPPVAWGGARLTEGLAVSACGLILVAYLIALWSAYQRAVEHAEESRTEAERAGQAKGAFLAAMSHEVRTPMNAVLGAARLLNGTQLDAVQADYVDMISNAGSVLMTVLNDVLDWSKIDAGKFQIVRAPSDLHAVVQRCARLWQPQAIAAGLDFEVSIDPGAPRYLELDPERLSQILFNLLSNAVNFTAAGGVRLAVDAAPLTADSAELRFTVTDTGRGIEPEALARLFQAFEQSDPSISRQFGGTGLGLAISQRLAKLMDGQITVRSEPGKGSVFTLAIPAGLSEAFESTSDPASPAQDARSGMRLLVAEDNAANQKIVAAFLAPLEASITFAQNGVEALDALGEQTFDLVLMDIQMPLMDGIEATRRLRASAGSNAGIPVIALTANVMDDQCAAYRAAGIDAEVAKPIDPRRLLQTIVEFV